MSNQTHEEIASVENDYWVDMAEALLRLENNPDFKKIILEGYFKDRAVNGVSMLCNAEVMRRQQRGNIMETLVAISQLQDYFITIKNMGIVMDDGPEVEDDIEG